MRCLDCEELIQYACGEAEEPERALADVHMEECPACKAEISALQAVVRCASNLGRKKLSASRARAIMQAAERILPLDPAQRRQMRQEQARVRTVRLAPVPALAAAALVAASISGFVASSGYRPSLGSRSITEEFDALLLEDGAVSAGSALRLLADSGPPYRVTKDA